MKHVLYPTLTVLSVVAAIALYTWGPESRALAQEGQTQTSKTDGKIAPEAIERSRKSIQILDNIFKQTIVLITDKYVHDEEDFAAGSAAVLLFKNISESGNNKVRLIDATGDPYDSENVAQDEFEKNGIRRLKAGAKTHEKVELLGGQPVLRTLTAVPVVMDKCVMCHAHYADVAQGEPIGAISYTVPIE